MMKRSFATELEFREESREIFGRMFPFNETAHIRELVDGQVDEYDECFLPGCTVRMQQVAQRRGGAPAWIGLTIDHQDTFDARLGFCTQIEERTDDGAFGTFRLYDGPHLPKLRSMLAESHTGLSIEFLDVATPIIDGSLRKRRQINISAVTATPIPVYATAGILAIRSADDVVHSETPNLDAVNALLTELGLDGTE